MERMSDYRKEFDLACEKIVKLEKENKRLKEENKKLKAIINHYKKFEEGKNKLEGMLTEEGALQ